jgi:outer membrane protein assembly factor BamD (BamD/ComL family)
MRRFRMLTSIFLGGAALIGSVERGLADKRVALVIGNYSYQNFEQLLNPKNDAPAIAKMFKDMGFDQVDLVTDVGNLQFKRAIRHFADASAAADVAVVYYAGHAIEVGGVNYMLPVDAKLASDRDIEDEAIDLDRIVDSDGAKKLRLVIVDACRDNPFLATKQQHQAVRSTASDLAARKSGLGLVNVAGSQTLVAYAAEAGTSAEDGVGDDAHSPFAAAVLRRLPEPVEDIRFAFGRIRDDVLKATDKRQRPFVYGSLGGDHISLVPGQLALNDVKGDYDRADKVGTRRAFEIFLAQYPTGYYADLAREVLGKLPPHAPPASDDTTAWEKIKDTTDQAALRNFLKRFPVSPLAINAEHRLQVLADGEVTRAWEKVDKDDAAAIHKFMKAFPASTLAADTGKARLNELDQQAKDREAKKQAEIAAAKKLEAEREAAQAWQKIKNASDRNVVLGFINRHPDSPLLAEAQQRLVAIDQEDRERKAKQEAEAAEAKKRQVEREAAQEWEKVKPSADPSALLAFLSRYPNVAVSDRARQRVTDLDREAREGLERQQKETEAAQREWDGIKSTDDRAALKAFIGRHPTSPLATGEAKQRLGLLDRAAKEREQQAAAAEATKRQMEREAAQEWEKIRSSTDHTALLTFVTRYPDAAVSDQARQRVADLDREARERLERQQKEAEAAQREWDGIQSTDDRAALKAFIGRHPTSPLATGEAKQRLGLLDRVAKEREQQAAAVEATKRQVEREAVQEWEKIRSSTDHTALLTFLTRYPDAAVSDQARQRVADLDREARERLERQQKEAEAAQREWDGIQSTDDRAALKAFIGRHPTSPLATGEAKQRLGLLDRAAKEREQQTAAAEATKRQVEREAAQEWEKVKPSTDPSALLAFLSRYPNVAVSEQARQRVADLDREARERLERQQKEAEAAQREWDGIKSADDRAALKAFIGHHPTSPLASEAKQRVGVLDREAKEREQQAAAAEATKRQVEREAALEWEKVRSSADQTALLTFLNRYPDTAVSNQTRQRLADLDRQAKETWAKIKDSADPGIIRGFIKQYPASLVVLDANERLLGVEREAHKKQAEAAAAQAEWSAVNKNDVAAIGDIVARFPDAPFAGDAKKRISELQREDKAQADKVAAARDWHELKNSRDVAAIRAFIRNYPTNSLALHEAKARLDTLTRESEPRPSAAGHAADASRHLQAASKPEPKPAEPAHRPEPSPRARNFSGIGF